MNTLSIFSSGPLLLPALCVGIGLGLAAAPAQAADWSWQASSGQRPDADGAMSRVATGRANDVLAVGEPLRLSSGNLDEWMFYTAVSSQLDMPEQLALSFTARYVAGQTESPLRSPLQVGAILEGNRGLHILISDGAVSFLRHDDAGFSATYAMDTTQFHDYRLWVSGPENGAPMALYVDGVLRLSGHIAQGSPFVGGPRIYFGDGSYAATGSTEWLAFAHNAAAVPEPGALALMLAGFAAVSGVARRRRAWPSDAP
jgi:hypothetical protein